jgi:glutathione synthase/RimK-type ligase-like ATP-grasp enzyme
MRLIGLYRETEYSPGRHRANDTELLERVANALRARGFQVDLMTLAEAPPRGEEAALVFSMCQGRAALDILARWEQDGALVINSPEASLNTYRDRLPGMMADAGVPFPATTLVATQSPSAAPVDVRRGVWLKRGDVHASVSADVQWVNSADGLHAGLRDFATRGIARAALQPHHGGDEVKFYAVPGSSFFHWYYSDAAGAGNGNGTGPEIHRHPLDVPALRRLAERAAAAAGLDIFGGDIIVEPSGALTLIDLNDWPSFAPCRERASEAIADYLMRRVDAAWNPGLVSSANESAV